MEASGSTAARRPLKSRQTAWAKTMAGWLTRAGVSDLMVKPADNVCKIW